MDHLSYIVATALLDVDGTRLGAVVTLCGCLWRNLAAIGSKKGLVAETFGYWLLK